MRAYRSNNWYITGQLPAALRRKLVVTVSYFENMELPNGTRSVSKEKLVDLAVETPQGLICPRSSFSMEDLRAAGFHVEDRSPSVEVWPEILEAASELQLRPGIQEEAVRGLIEADGGFLLLAPGKGKTVMSLKVASRWGQPVLVFVDNGGLLDQWQKRIMEFWRIPPSRIGICRGPFNKWSWEGLPISVAMFNSVHRQYTLGRMSPEFFEYFGTVIWDEAQLAKAATRASTLSMFPSRRVGLSATPGNDGTEEFLYHHLGFPVVEDRKSDLNPKCYFRRVYPTNVRQYPKNMDSKTIYARMLTDYLGGPRRRPDPQYLEDCATLLRSLLNEGRKILLICPRTRFSETLAEEFEEMVIIDQGMAYEDRDDALNSSPLVAVSPQIGERALDRKDLDTLVLAFPVGKNAVDRAQQAAGRILRASEGKRQPKVFLLFPTNHRGLALAQANESIFSDLGYEIAEPARPGVEANHRQRRRDVARVARRIACLT